MVRIKWIYSCCCCCLTIPWCVCVKVMSSTLNQGMLLEKELGSSQVKYNNLWNKNPLVSSKAEFHNTSGLLFHLRKQISQTIFKQWFSVSTLGSWEWHFQSKETFVEDARECSLFPWLELIWRSCCTQQRWSVSEVWFATCVSVKPSGAAFTKESHLMEITFIH